MSSNQVLSATEEERSHLLINLLVNIRDGATAVIARKEISAWSAAALYLTGLAALVGFILNNSVDGWMTIYCIMVVFVLGCCFLGFIHAQFGSLYYQIGLQSAVTQLAFNLIQSEQIVSSKDFFITEGSAFPLIIEEKAKQERLKFCRSNQHQHFGRILESLWRFKTKEMTSQEKQEALIYSILLIALLGVVVLLSLRAMTSGIVSENLSNLFVCPIPWPFLILLYPR